MRRLTLALLALVLAMPSVAAQDASPVLVAQATRDFEASGLRLVGTLAITTSVYEMASDADAELALPMVVNAALAMVEDGGGSMQLASATDVGDESFAYAGEIADPANPETTYVSGILAWRDGPVVVLMVGGALAGDPLTDLAMVARNIEGREPANAIATPPATPQGVGSGGIWDRLPTLADMPDGFVFKSDQSE